MLNIDVKEKCFYVYAVLLFAAQAFVSTRCEINIVLNINKLLRKFNSGSYIASKLRFNDSIFVYSSYTYVTLRREDFLEKLLVHIRRDEKAEGSPL